MTDRCNPAEPLADAEVRVLLAPGLPGDDLVLRIVAALRADGATVDVEDAGGIGPCQALIIANVDGCRMRVTAQPW